MEAKTRELVKNCLDCAVKQQEVAGASVLIFKDGKEELYYEAGMADIKNQINFQRDTIVRLYSATKPITAVAAMILMERGLLDAGAWVSEYLPEYQNLSYSEGKSIKPSERNILVKEVLNMTSGLAYGGDDTNAGSKAVGRLFDEIEKNLTTEHSMTTREVVRRIADCPLAFKPGEKWMYGTSADVMGAIVEEVSGMRFGEFLKKEIFEPLGMNDTDFYVPKEKQSRLAKVYENSEEGLREYKTNHLGISYPMDTPPAFESGGAGLASTIDDYMKFAQMLLNQGKYNGRRILSKRMVQYLSKADLMSWQQESMNRAWESLNGYTYGNFLRILKNPEKANMLGTKGEYGWDGWLGFYFINSPADNLTMLLSCQKKDAGTMPLTRKLKNIIWSELYS